VTKEKNGKAKEKKVKKERQPHPFGAPEARAKGYNFPSPNPILFVHAGKPTTNLPENLRQVFEAIGKHASGVPLKDLKVAKLGGKTLQWLVRKLCKHGYVRA
jgi:hypothetical protein